MCYYDKKYHQSYHENNDRNMKICALYICIFMFQESPFRCMYPLKILTQQKMHLTKLFRLNDCLITAVCDSKNLCRCIEKLDPTNVYCRS